MSKEECLEHGKQHSKCFNKKEGVFYQNTPWATDFDAMAMKSVLIQLMKLFPKSIEIQKAIAADETIKTTVDADMLTMKDETNWENGEIIEHKEETKEVSSRRVLPTRKIEKEVYV